MVKNLPPKRETWVWSLGWEDPLEKGMQPTPVFLPGEFHGQRSLEGYSSWSCKELDMTEQLTLSFFHSTQIYCWGTLPSLDVGSWMGCQSTHPTQAGDSFMNLSQLAEISQNFPLSGRRSGWIIPLLHYSVNRGDQSPLKGTSIDSCSPDPQNCSGSYIQPTLWTTHFFCGAHWCGFCCWQPELLHWNSTWKEELLCFLSRTALNTSILTPKCAGFTTHKMVLRDQLGALNST